MGEAPKGPRRRIMVQAAIQGDSWESIQSELINLATDIAMYGRLSKSSVSGGYSTGHIVTSDEDDSITHESWSVELKAYLDALRAREPSK